MIESQKRRLGVVAKGLDRKLVDGEEKFSDQLKQLMPEGPFEEKVAVFVHVRGTVGKGTTAERYLGVSHDDMLNLAIGFFGATEDSYRKLAAGVIEYKRAELEEREVEDVTWEDSQGREHIISAAEIVAAAERGKARNEQMKADAGTTKFSALVKKTVPMSGRFDVAYIGCRARIATEEELSGPGFEHLKQTKDDAAAHGMLVEPKKRKTPVRKKKTA